MDIRKISVGPDYKSGAMHYLINQVVLGGNYTIHRITQDSNNNNFLIYIENEDEEVFLWKSSLCTSYRQKHKLLAQYQWALLDFHLRLLITCRRLIGHSIRLRHQAFFLKDQTCS